jgi:hypothetical protein
MESHKFPLPSLWIFCLMLVVPAIGLIVKGARTSLFHVKSGHHELRVQFSSSFVTGMERWNLISVHA